MAHEIRKTALDTDNQAAIKRKIEEENRRLYPSLEVTQAYWIHGTDKSTARGEEKRYSTLIIHVTNSEVADEMIKIGIIESSEMKRVERYDQRASSIQCFRYQRYGHITNRCENEVRCAECEQSHNTWDHEKLAPTALKARAPCGRAGHVAYSRDCPLRVREKQKATQRIANKA